jgi:hypothetical protein
MIALIGACLPVIFTVAGIKAMLSPKLPAYTA